MLVCYTHIFHVLFSVPLCAHISTADFMVAPLVLTFDSDTPLQEVMVTALPDTVSEGDEDFSLSLTGDTAVQFTISTATVNITDASKMSMACYELFMSAISLSSCCPGFQ